MVKKPTRFSKLGRPILYVLIALFALSMFFSATASQATIVEGRWTPSEPENVTKNSARRYYVNGVVQMKNGNILVAYQNSLNTNEWQDAYTSGKISSDNGATWGDAFTVTDQRGEGKYNLCPSLVVADNGTVIVFFDAINSSEQYFPLQFSKSYDNGVTWSTPENVDSENGMRIICAASNGLNLNGTLYQPAYNHYYNDICYLYTSADNGETWSLKSTIDSGNGLRHPTIIDLENGDLLCVMYNFSTKNNYYKTSNDNGSTWGSLQEVKDTNRNNIRIDFPKLERIGWTYFVHGRDQSVAEEKLVIRTSTNGITWSSLTVLESYDGASTHHSSSEAIGSDLLITFSSKIYNGTINGNMFNLFSIRFYEEYYLSENYIVTSIVMVFGVFIWCFLNHGVI